MQWALRTVGKNQCGIKFPEMRGNKLPEELDWIILLVRSFHWQFDISAGTWRSGRFACKTGNPTASPAANINEQSPLCELKETVSSPCVNGLFLSITSQTLKTATFLATEYDLPCKWLSEMGLSHTLINHKSGKAICSLNGLNTQHFPPLKMLFVHFLICYYQVNTVIFVTGLNRKVKLSTHFVEGFRL